MTPMEWWIVGSMLVFMVWVAYTVEDNETYADDIVARVNERERETRSEDLIAENAGLRTALAAGNERETDLREVIRNRNVAIATLQTENADLRAAVTFWQTKVDTLQSTIDNDNGVSNAWSDNLFK